MEPDIQALIDERYAELPERLRGFIRQPSVHAAIRIVGEKHNLPAEKASVFENEVMLTLMGFEPVERLDERIMAELLIPGSAAASMARDIDAMVFSEVRTELAELADRYFNEDASPAETPIVVAATPARPEPPAYEHDAPEVPLYGKPITDMPRYVTEDPYREPPR